MFRRLVPGVVLAALALSFTSLGARAAEDPAALDELVRRSIAGELGARRSANEALVPATLALSGPIDPATYRLGPGDKLVVQWTGRVTRSEFVDVGPAGDVFLSEIGSMNVAGQTLVAARRVILERLQRLTRDVRVEVQLARPRVFRVYLSGAVASPGPVEAVGGSRVSDIVRPDGLQPGASHRNLRVLHPDGTYEAADLERVFRIGDHSRDVWLRDGDAIVVPFSSEYVHISGAVLMPGMFERAGDDSLSTLLKLAGGLRPEAAPDGAQWIHWATSAAPETLTIDAHGVLAGSFDAALAHGDRVFIRALPDFRKGGEMRIEGDVARPGGYPVSTTGTRLSAILAAAGGMLPTADPSGIRLRRLSRSPIPTVEEQVKRSQAVQRELSVTEFEVSQAQLAVRNGDIMVDWTAVQRSPRALDPLIEDGDVVTVPRLVNSLRIDGQVVKPGVLYFEPGLSLRKYVDQAGGYSGRAWRGHEQVTRAGTTHTLLARSAGDLRPGDTVWVPMRPEDSVWRRSAALLSALAQIATIVIAIRSVR